MNRFVNNMNRKESESKFSLSLSSFNILKLGLFQTIYAKGPCENNPPPSECPPPNPCCPPPNPCCSPRPKEADKCGGGDAPAIKVCKCKVPEPPCSAGDRGKTGAGVTGSRACRNPCIEDDRLPCGAINPGLLRHIHNAARHRLPQCFEGACLSVKQTNCNWTFGHSLAFSSVTPGGYKLLMSYTDKNKASSMPYFVMEAAPGGQVSCEMRVGPTGATRATVVAQIADAEIYSFESIMDAYFNRFTASIIAVNKEFIALHYIQVLFLASSYLFLFYNKLICLSPPFLIVKNRLMTVRLWL